MELFIPPTHTAGPVPRLNIVNRAIDELQLDPRNPRQHSRKQIKRKRCGDRRF